METIDLTKCRGAYKCTITELKRKRGGEYYIAELEFPNDKKIVIDMQLILELNHKLYQAMASKEKSKDPLAELIELADSMLMDEISSPFVRDIMLKQIR